jgi:hypothetical protein
MSHQKVERTQTACGSRSRLADELRSGNGLTLARGELAVGLGHCRCDTLPPSRGETTAQDSHQFRLRIGIELFGGIQDFGKRILMTHGNLPQEIL